MFIFLSKFDQFSTYYFQIQIIMGDLVKIRSKLKFVVFLFMLCTYFLYIPVDPLFLIWLHGIKNAYGHYNLGTTTHLMVA